MTTIARRAFTVALRDYLRDGLELDGEIGQSPKPADGETAPAMPYFILWSLPGGGLRGSAQMIESDATLVYQVTVVGERTDQIEEVQDRVRDLLVGRNSDGSPVLVDSVLGGLKVQLVDAQGFGGTGEIASEIGSGGEQYAFAVTSL